MTRSVNRKDAYIQVIDGKKSREYEINPSLDTTLSENCRILYPSLQKQRSEKMVVMTPYGEVIWIFPQSEIQFEFDGKNLTKVTKLNGRV